jgi:hypothetical protein
MRRNGYSAAFREYERSLSRAACLHRIEVRGYRDPPGADEQIAVEALRGGATVLMVASLERYLKDAFEEFVDLVAARARSTNHPKLSPSFVEWNDFNFFNWLIRESRMPKSLRIAELKRVSQLVATDRFVPEAFSRTRSNPGPRTVSDLFREYGISNPMAIIEQNFVRHFKKPFPGGYVSAALGAIIDKRNEVAHGGYALTLSRTDLLDWIHFLTAFGKAADNTLRDHTICVLATL